MATRLILPFPLAGGVLAKTSLVDLPRMQSIELARATDDFFGRDGGSKAAEELYLRCRDFFPQGPKSDDYGHRQSCRS